MRSTVHDVTRFHTTSMDQAYLLRLCANQAIDTIARSRTGFDPATKYYIKRRTEEGKTKCEIRRCLKRFIARQLFRKIDALMA